MNGRTCQLCGKALSRFTVGSGGDFCSREHRNQFRLRVGMDRLLEANKVASLMRRRENAKTIPAAQLARDSKVLPRIAQLLHPPARQPDVQPLRRLPTPLEKPAIVQHSENLVTALRPAAPVRAEARAIEPHAFELRTVRPILRPRTERFAAQILAAGAVVPRLNSARVAQMRREAKEIRLNLQRTYIGGNGIQVRPSRTSAQSCQEPQPPRRLSNSADRGRELRVSGGIGFRLAPARIRPVDFARPQITPPSRFTRPRTLNPGSRPKKSEFVTAGVIRFALRLPYGPTPPNQKNGAALQWPNALVSTTERPRHGDSIARTCDVRWAGPSPIPPQLRHGNGVVRLRPPAPQNPLLSAPRPRGMESERRLTVVSFQPQETPFECAPSALHGSFLSSLHFGATPLRKVESPPVTLEEHFDGGLHNWIGGTEDWKVDVAGVRAGSLAIYSPSTDVPNYLLEFLTRIEVRGVTWVFRAANFTDYYKATLALAPGGGYEFRRHAVLGGTAEEATVRSVPPASPNPTGKTAVTIRTRVSGNEFTVSIDGQAIDTWTDARLIEGGVGFVSAPEERARLYWVKVTPIGHLSKEYSKR